MSKLKKILNDIFHSGKELTQDNNGFIDGINLIYKFLAHFTTNPIYSSMTPLVWRSSYLEWNALGFFYMFHPLTNIIVNT